jgi:hypothetical protein
MTSATSLLSRLHEIEARAGKATPGPWVTRRPNDGVLPKVFVTREFGSGVPPKFYVASLPDMASGDSDADAAMIASSRTDIPAMAETIREMARVLVGSEFNEYGRCVECSRLRFEDGPHPLDTSCERGSLSAACRSVVEKKGDSDAL